MKSKQIPFSRYYLLSFFLTIVIIIVGAGNLMLALLNASPVAEDWQAYTISQARWTVAYCISLLLIGWKVREKHPWIGATIGGASLFLLIFALIIWVNAESLDWYKVQLLWWGHHLLMLVLSSTGIVQILKTSKKKQAIPRSNNEIDPILDENLDL